MRILIISPYHTAGGAETAANEQIKLLQHHGHTVAHFSLGTDHPTNCPAVHYSAGADTAQRHKNNKGVFKKFWQALYWIEQLSPSKSRQYKTRLKAALESFQPDVVHIHPIAEFMWHIDFFSICKEMGIPTVMTFHSAWYVCPSGKLLKGPNPERNAINPCDALCAKEPNPGQACANHECISSPVKAHFKVKNFKRRLPQIPQLADVFTCPSEALKQQICTGNHISPETVYILHNSIFAPVTEHSVDNEDSYFLFVGRLEWYKGVADLINVFCELPHLTLKIVGDGPELNKMAKKITSGRHTNIQLLGWQSGAALKKLYVESYALIVPTHCFESYGIVVAEALYNKKPVIASATGGIQEIIIPDVTGLLYSPGDKIALKKQVETLWNEKAMAKQFGLQGYDYICKQLDTHKIYTDMLAIYQQAVTRQQALSRR